MQNVSPFFHLSIDGVKQLVRAIPDFPKKGILFKDITPALEPVPVHCLWSV